MKKFTKKILFQLNLLAAIALLLAYGANHISPASFWPIAFFGLAYPYLLTINILYLLFWIWWRKKYAFLSLLVIVLGFSNVGRYIQLRINTDIPISDSTQFKLLSYNVRVFNAYNWSGENIGRDSIIRYVATEEADIVCFQEFVTQSHLENESEEYTKKLMSNTPFSHVRYTLLTNKARRKFGTATYSKFPIIRKGSIQFERSYNSCIYSDLLVNGDTIRVYNLHLQSISLLKSYSVMDSMIYMNAKRLEEVKDISGRLRSAFMRRALQVDAVKRHVESSPYPVILCGDFNDTPVSYSYHQLIGDRKDSFREVGSGVGKTYRGSLPSYRIDYVFHDKEFMAINYETPKVMLSDHFPVVCTLKKQ